MTEELRDKIEDIIVPLIREAGLELVELKIVRKGKVVHVVVLADKPRGGISIDECTLINRRLSQKIEEDNFIIDDYVVEVSSPGLDRPLKSKKDFLRAMGCMVRFHLSELVENKLDHEGMIHEVFDDNVVIKTKNSSVAIPLDKIHKAVQIIL